MLCCLLKSLFHLLVPIIIITIISRTQTPAPLSFIAFKSTCHQLTLNQDITSLAQQSDSDSKDGCVFGTSLEKYFRACVKAKKRHEVDLLADVSYDISDAA